MAHQLAENCRTSLCAGQRAALVAAGFRSSRSRARPSGAPAGGLLAAGGTSGRRPRSRRPPTNRYTQRKRHPTSQLARVRRRPLVRPRAPSHQSPASTARVQGAPTSRHYVIGKPTLDPLRCGLRSAATGCRASCGRGLDPAAWSGHVDRQEAQLGEPSGACRVPCR